MNPNPANSPVVAPPTKGIWQILANESASAYDAFTVYLELLPDATLQQVADKIGKSLEAIRHLSSRHAWIERAAAWRHHLAATTFTEMASKHLENQKLCSMRQQVLRQQEWECSQKIALLGSQVLDRLLNDPHATFRAYELVPLLRFASQCGHNATAIDPKAEEERDLENDPVILEFRAHVQKVCEGRADNNKPEAQPGPSASQPQGPDLHPMEPKGPACL